MTDVSHVKEQVWQGIERWKGGFGVSSSALAMGRLKNYLRYEERARLRIL